MARIETPWGVWDHAPLAEVRGLFDSFDRPWWIAGGYAVEHAVGHAFREHADIDVLLLRPDQLAVQQLLPDWEWWAADPPGTLRPWRAGEILPAHVHDIWCRPGPDEPWRVQFMLDETDGTNWISRRDARIRRPIEELGEHFLVPEIQLFYKARVPRPKDEQDFAMLLPLLDDAQKHWLIEAIDLAGGAPPWRARLLA
jgi:hypothetical protein